MVCVALLDGSSQDAGFPRWHQLAGVGLARRTFRVVDVMEILVHWSAGRSQSEIATSLGLDRKTVKKYVAPAVTAGLTPGGPPMSTADWERLVRSWFPELVDTRGRQTTWAESAAHHEDIKDMVGGVTEETVWQ